MEKIALAQVWGWGALGKGASGHWLLLDSHRKNSLCLQLCVD